MGHSHPVRNTALQFPIHLHIGDENLGVGGDIHYQDKSNGRNINRLGVLLLNWGSAKQ